MEHERRKGSEGVTDSLNAAFVERLYEDLDRKTQPEMVALFQAGLWGSEVSRQAMYELAKRWHFFDPILSTESALWKRRCFMELLILSGMWHPDGAKKIFDAHVQTVHEEHWWRFWMRRLYGIWRPKKKE